PLAAPCSYLHCALRCPASACLACCAAMASLYVLAFDHEGCPIHFDTWLDDLQLYLLSDSRDSVSLFDHTSGATPAPPATDDYATRSQWLTRDAAACLAIRNHLPLAECSHLGQHRTAQALYDAVVAHYSSPATAALGRLLLPYLFPKLSAFATVEDLVSHLRTSDARYRAAGPADVVAVGAACGTPHTPFFEGCSPSPLAPSYASADAVDVIGAEDVRAASASAKHRRSKGKGGRGGGSGSKGGGGGSSGVVEAVEVVGVVGVVAGVGALVEAVVAGLGVAVVAAVGVVAVGLELLSVEVREVARGSSSSVGPRPRAPAASSGLAIFDLDYDAILSTMYALFASVEGDCYLCVPPDPGIEATALGASEAALPSTSPTEALHTFTLDSDASRCLHLPSFSTNLVSTATLQDTMVTTTTPGGQRVSICTCTRTGRHLATFTRRPGSSLYTLAIEPPQVAASAQVSVSVLVAPLCSCRLLSHQTLLWHHHLGHPCLPRLRGMLSRLLVWSSEGRERYFVLVVDDYVHYTMVFPLCSKGEVPDVLIPWIHAVNLQLPEWFSQDLLVLHLHSDRGVPHWLSHGGRSYLHDPCGCSPFSVVVCGLDSRAFVRDTSADKLSARAIPCVFLGFPLDAPGWWFYHPTSRRVFPTQDVTFDESVPFYHSAPPPPPPLFLAPSLPPVDPLAPQDPAPSRVSQVDPLPGTVPVEVAVASGAAKGAASGGCYFWG
ncbi:unnamed protein product, partial [Closterium sp. NIES-53]